MSKSEKYLFAFLNFIFALSFFGFGLTSLQSIWVKLLGLVVILVSLVITVWFMWVLIKSVIEEKND